MLSSQIKQIIALSAFLLVGYVAFTPGGSVLGVISWLVAPVMTLLLIDDWLAIRRRRVNRFSPFRWKGVDICFLALFGWEIISPLFAPDWLGVQRNTNDILAIVILYFFGRLYLQRKGIRWLICGITVFGTIVGVFILISSVMFFDQLSDYGFEAQDIVPIRYLFSPGGMMINDWSGILIAFMPFAVLTFSLSTGWRKYLWALPPLIVSGAIVCTLSRGAYGALFLFIGAVVGGFVVWRLMQVSKLLIVIGVYFIFLASISIPFRSTIRSMVVLREASSQRESIAGRFDRWDNCLSLFKEHPVMGIGNGRYALESMIITNREGSVYTRRFNNLGVQLLTEKGVFGTLIYLVCLFFVYRTAYRPLKIRPKVSSDELFCSVIFLSGLAAVLFREMTFTTLLEQPACLYLVMSAMLSIIISFDHEKRETVAQ